MFTKAITRKPCKALIDGISTAQFCNGTPDYETAVKQHDCYVTTLRELGLAVTDLEADERYPDSCFVEDPAGCHGSQLRYHHQPRANPECEKWKSNRQLKSLQ